MKCQEDGYTLGLMRGLPGHCRKKEANYMWKIDTYNTEWDYKLTF